jgi:hypothetical protein
MLVYWRVVQPIMMEISRWAALVGSLILIIQEGTGSSWRSQMSCDSKKCLINDLQLGTGQNHVSWKLNGWTSWTDESPKILNMTSHECGSIGTACFFGTEALSGAESSRVGITLGVAQDPERWSQFNHPKLTEKGGTKAIRNIGGLWHWALGLLHYIVKVFEKVPG